MSKTYFVFSDTHSFAKELKIALKEAGFDRKNKEHCIIFCGDLFDRGNESMEIYRFIRSIPKYRRILVKGNHEELYDDLLYKNYPDYYDFSNGTVKTFCQIAGVKDVWYEEKTWREIRTKVKKSDITKFLHSKEWKDYYELGKYIFVHSFIPRREDWRNANYREWSRSRWGCPWEQYKNGLFDAEAKKGKILVCGHWHTSDFRENLDGDYNSDNYGVYYGDNIIGIDGGVWYDENRKMIHKQNVLVIKEEEL